MDMNPSPATLEKFIEELYARGVVQGEDGTVCKILPMSLAPGRGAFLRDVCRAERPTSTIEIGMAYGLSTLFIIQTLLENDAASRRHVVMDPFQTDRFHDAGRRVIREAGVEPLVDFHQDYSEYVLPRLLREGRRFDLAFVDGNHCFDHVFVDLFYLDRLLKASGLLVLDDCFLDSVHAVCRFVQTNYGYTVFAQYPVEGSKLEDEISPARSRPLMRAMRKPAEQMPRDKFYFVPFFARPSSDTAARESMVEATGPEVSRSEPLPRVTANRLRHEAFVALARGDRHVARAGFLNALRLQPLHFKTYLRMLRTFLPPSMIRLLSSSTRRRETSGDE
jgi:predicted O-methyltransferase YrrM